MNHRLLLAPSLILAPLLLSTPVAAQEAPSQARQRATVEKLVSFGTRHSLSSATDPRRGIGAARAWVAGEFAKLSRTCGGFRQMSQLPQSSLIVSLK